VTEDAATAVRGALCYIGDRLGLFKTLAGRGPLTVEGLAGVSRLQERYLREWLGAMVTAGYVAYDQHARQYELPPEHAVVLADEGSPDFLGGMLEMIVPLMSVTPRVAEAFRKGGGVPLAEYPAELFEGMERSTAPSFRHCLVQKWLPALPHVRERLATGATALDVGCGAGVAAITLALAFPRTQMHAYDSHSESIARARENANKAGIADRIVFEVRDCAGDLPKSRFEFITSFHVIHDAAAPVRLLSAIREALKPGGTFLLVEGNCSSEVHENMNLNGRLFYPMSVLYCLTTSLAAGGPGIGAMCCEKRVQELAASAGFNTCRRLEIEDPSAAFYELLS
jgi:2-polyprenyl-3-methyl-5-hydroxy-6-metoxy-1,4-benzoquinol methylase